MDNSVALYDSTVGAKTSSILVAIGFKKTCKKYGKQAFIRTSLILQILHYKKERGDKKMAIGNIARKILGRSRASAMKKLKGKNHQADRVVRK